jgi:hypothetical protein
MPYALCPMPYALCPMPYALCRMPYALKLSRREQPGFGEESEHCDSLLLSLANNNC